MSIFSRSDDALDMGSKRAIADVLSSTFGFDEDDLGDFEDLDPSPEEMASDLEVEMMMDEEFMSPILEDLFFDDYEDEEDLEDLDDLDFDEEPSSPPTSPMGRVGMVSKVRQEYGRISSSPHGVQAHLPSYQVPTYQVPSHQVPSYQAPGVIHGLHALIPQVKIATVPSYGAVNGQKQASVEAGPTSLPPVYVADPVTASQIKIGTRPQSLQMETSFGAMADRGIVGCQVRPRAKKAAQNAVFRGAQAVANAPFRPPQPFVEDRSASPVLLSDGRVVDTMHGELSTLPCPSCSRMTRKSAYGGQGDDCSVCDGFGAVLIPDSDVPSYTGCSSYGFLQFLAAPVAGLISGHNEAVSQRKATESALVAEKKEKVRQRLLKRLESGAGEGPDLDLDGDSHVDPDQDFDADDSEDESFGFDEDVFGDFDDDLEDEDLGSSDEDDDSFDEDEFGIDEWAEDAFGSDDDEDDDLDDLDDSDDEGLVSSSVSSPDLVRALIPSTGTW